MTKGRRKTKTREILKDMIVFKKRFQQVGGSPFGLIVPQDWINIRKYHGDTKFNEVVMIGDNLLIGMGEDYIDSGLRFLATWHVYQKIIEPILKQGREPTEIEMQAYFRELKKEIKEMEKRKAESVILGGNKAESE